MVVLEIYAEAEKAVVSDYEEFMHGDFIPALMATECFRDVEFSKTSRHVYRLRMIAKSHEALEQYFSNYAESFRRRFAANVPSGVILTTPSDQAMTKISQTSDDEVRLQRMREATDR